MMRALAKSPFLLFLSLGERGIEKTFGKVHIPDGADLRARQRWRTASMKAQQKEITPKNWRSSSAGIPGWWP